MRRLLPVLLVSALLAPAFAQDTPSERERKAATRAEEALREELARVRRAMADLVRQELGSAPAAGDLDKALGLITVELLRKHASFLASDELEGRNAGYPGNDKASEYLRDHLKKYGLKPAGDEEEGGGRSYFQKFKVGGRETRNVIAMVEGTDAVLKKDVLVVGAHFDHVGTADQGHWGRLGRARDDDEIWNGADDNGSGTSTVLAMARAFGEGGLKARRTILFMFFSGEEGGLIGSRFYCKNPTFPIDRHVFMLNLDMVGRNPEKPVSIEGVGSAEDGVIRKAVEAAVAKTGLKAAVNDNVKLVGGDSDHTSFRNKGIPFAFFFSGFHPDYHTVLDHPEKLAYENMEKIGRTASRILLDLGNSDVGPKFKDLRFGDIPAVPRRRTLGVTSADLTAAKAEELGLKAGEGGVLVEEVTAGSTAEKAGIQAGDLIVSIGGKSLGKDDPLKDLRTGIEAATPGHEVPVVVLRDGKRQTLKAVWEK